jgi:O-antigen/teichoic acid export membrane protein
LIRNSSVQIVGHTLGSVISVFTFASITRGLGPGPYGHYAAALAFLGIPIVLSDLGLSTSLVRQISRDPDATAEVISAGVSARALLAGATLGCAVVLGIILPFPRETTAVIAIAAVASFFLLMNTSLVPALQAQLKMHWAVLANISGRGVTLVLTLVLLAHGGGLQSVAWAYVIGNAVTLLVDSVVVSRLVRLRFVVDVRRCLRLLRATVVLGLVLAVDSLFVHLDTLLLGVFRSSAEVGLFASASKFVGFVLIAGNAIHISVFPVINRYLETGDKRLRAILEGATQGLFILSAPIVVISLVIPGPTMSLLSGAEFAGAGPVLRIFAPLFPVLFLGYLYSFCLVADHREGLLLALNLGALGANAIAFCSVVPSGGLQAAAAVSVASATALTIAVGIAVRNRLGYLPRFAGLGGAAAAGGCMVPILLLVPARPLIAIALAGVVYAAAIALFPGTPRHVLADLSRAALVYRFRGRNVAQA